MDALKGKVIKSCLQKKENELIATDFGKKLIAIIDDSLKVPNTTAEMKYKLSEIVVGKKRLGEYLDEIITMRRRNLQYLEIIKFPIKELAGVVTCTQSSNMQSLSY